MRTPPDAPNIDTDLIRAGLRRSRLPHAFTRHRLTYIGRFSNDIWRLDLDNGVALVIKQSYREARPGEHPDTERRFYQLMSNRSGLPLPRLVAEWQGTLVLEHLELEPFSFADGAATEHAQAAVDALADLHAAFWNAPPQASWLPDLIDGRVRGAIQHHYDAAWARHRARLLAYAPAFATLGDRLTGRLAETLVPLARPATLVHGDAHAENVALAGGHARLLDWQDPQIGNPGLDLAVFMTMSFRQEQRQHMERDLVARYARRLEAHGCQWPDPWQGYRLGLLRRVARIVEIASPDFVSLPWVFRRTAGAAIQHEVHDLIA